MTKMRRYSQHPNKARLLLFLLALAGAFTARTARADGGRAPAVQETEIAPGSPLHPTFPLLDSAGENVLDSGNPVSTMETCGACHDTDFIAGHSFHADVGLGAWAGPGQAGTGRAWDSSPGLFGRWNPLTYRYLSPAGDGRIDLTTVEWLQTIGARHVGGGPAVYARDGAPLVTVRPEADNPETAIVASDTGELQPWDWASSGVVEMNCFLCHTPDPANKARIAALEAGEFGWANTATLLNTGLVEAQNGRYRWKEEAFGGAGETTLAVQDPTAKNCGQCHGTVHTDAQEPLTIDSCSIGAYNTFTTGQIYSPQQLTNSGLNLSGKAALDRSWDVHAERVLECTDCHYALNNPVYYRELGESRPEHLEFDPRRIDIGDYLLQPLHQFAKGQSAQGILAPELDNTLRRCESCHASETTHDWLPYQEKHMAALSCETCHAPRLYAPAAQSLDWTVLTASGEPRTACRGLEGDGGDNGLISSYEPVLLPRSNGDGTTSLAPHNLVTAWFWVYGEPARPVPLRDLQIAYFGSEAGTYHADVLAAFDANGDGRLGEGELLLDDETKEKTIAGRLEAQGLADARIVGEVLPYSINHNVAGGEWALKECAACHGERSRVTQPLLLSTHVPGGALPTLVSAPGTQARGELQTDGNGALYYQPLTAAGDEEELASLYIFGHDNVSWVDWLGALLFLGTLAGASIHGGLRYVAARRHIPEETETREVYMYGVYERLWHWLQTVVIFGLLFTGLIIHKPEMFGRFSFRYVVEIHNILAAILLVNALLSAFYHLASGEIQQFLPRPRGFFDQAFTQTKFYLRGIFRGDPHPYEKTTQRKLNPLQQLTYFGLLNVLLPLQVITGILMWGAQRWPEITTGLGGLPFLAPFHTLIAWLFATFIVMHVYLTTTGHTPTANIRAMIMGWDEVEVTPAVSDVSTEASI